MTGAAAKAGSEEMPRRHAARIDVYKRQALSTAVAEDADIVAALDVISHAFGKAPVADGRACLVYTSSSAGKYGVSQLRV